jgi:hypothetical protein
MASLSPNTSNTSNTSSVDGLGNVYRSYELSFDDDRGLDVFIVQTLNEHGCKEEGKEDIQQEEKNNDGQPASPNSAARLKR